MGGGRFSQDEDDHAEVAREETRYQWGTTRLDEQNSLARNVDRGSLAWPLHACMNNWVHQSRAIQPGTFARYEVAWRLMGRDSLVFPDDEIYTIAPDEDSERDNHPNFRVLWGSSEFDISPEGFLGIDPPGWSGQQPILSSDPIRWCTGTESPSICVATRIVEVL